MGEAEHGVACDCREKLLRRVTDTHFNNFSWKLGKLIPCLLGAAVVNRVAVTRCYRLRRLGHLGATHEEGILGISLLTFALF